MTCAYWSGENHVAEIGARTHGAGMYNVHAPCVEDEFMHPLCATTRYFIHSTDMDFSYLHYNLT